MMTQYRIGWNKYASGRPLSACTNEEQRRGWNAANRAQAAAETAMYMEANP